MTKQRTHRPGHRLTCLVTGLAAVFPATYCGIALGGESPLESVVTAVEPDAVAAPVSTLRPVVVTATRTQTPLFDTPASVDIVEGERMREGKLQINLSESMGGVPGVLVQNRQNYAQDLQISIRGFGARSTFGVRGIRLYVDGIPATMPDGQGQTSNIDIGSIERVEVLRGPFSALYGNSSGGVIQVFTEEGSYPPSLTGSFAAGSYSTWRYGAKASGAISDDPNALNYVISGNRFTTHGYRDHSGARRNQGNIRLGWRPSNDSNLTLIVNHVDVKAQDPLGLDRADFDNAPRRSPRAEEFNTRKHVKQTQGGLVFEKDITSVHSMSVMVYYGQRDTLQYLAIPPAPQLNSPLHAGGVVDLKRSYGGADVRWSADTTLAGRPFTAIAGVSYDTMKEDRKGYENFRDTPNGRELGITGNLRRDETNRIHSIDPYIQTSWEFADQWTLDAGLRYSTIRFRSRDHYVQGSNPDDSGSVRYREWLPMAALKYQATPDLNLYVSYGRGFETPTFNEVSYRPDGAPGLNFDLQPAVNTSVELGAKWRTRYGSLSAALFQTRTREEIVVATSSGGRSTYQNAGKTRRNGLELTWNHTFADYWQAQAAYTWIDAEYREDVCMPAPCGQNPILKGNRIPGVARHAAYAAVGWTPPEGWRAGVDLRWLSKIPVNDANSEYAPGYVVAGAGAGYLWRRGPWELNAFARIDNLFDRRYAGSVIVNEGNGRYYEPAAGRNWSAGLTAVYQF